jgi:hypothetical protein
MRGRAALWDQLAALGRLKGLIDVLPRKTRKARTRDDGQTAPKSRFLFVFFVFFVVLFSRADARTT